MNLQDQYMQQYGVFGGPITNAFARRQKQFQQATGGQAGPTTDEEGQIVPSARGNDDLYGIFPTQYAASLAAASKDPAYGGAFRSRLEAESEDEVDRYEQMLRAAQVGAQQLANTKAQGDVTVAGLNNYEHFAKAGTTQSLYDILPFLDPVQAIASDARASAMRDAEQFKTVGEGAKESYDAGIQIDPNYAARLATSPLDTNPQAVEDAYGVFPGPNAANPTAGFNPADTSKYTTSQAQMLGAEADMLQAKNAPEIARIHASGKGGGGSTTTTVYLPDGTPISTTVKTKGSNIPQGAAPATTRFRYLPNEN